MSQNQIQEQYMTYGMMITGTAFFGGIFLPDAGSFFLCNGIAWIIAIFIFYTGHQKQKEYDRNEKKDAIERNRIAAKQDGERRLQQTLETQRKSEEERLRNEREAREKEDDLDYVKAARIWDSLGNRTEAKRLRKKMREEGKVKVDQTVVHGDYVDDRDTIIKDSVLNRSNVGAGGDDKFTKLKELKEMLSEGLIDDDEFKQMKKEILGK
jgi:uncharacterized membrane protein